MFRPLIGSDKQEIIARAKQIGTYDISSQATPDCCTLFMPRHPARRMPLDAVHEAWELFDHDAMIDRLVASVEYVDFESASYRRPRRFRERHEELGPAPLQRGVRVRMSLPRKGVPAAKPVRVVSRQLEASDGWSVARSW